VKSLMVFLVIFGAMAGLAVAQDAMPQPLTRADCVAASGWSWNETANVCALISQQEPRARPQPLTRSDCELAGMSWNDSALACEEKPAGLTQAEGSAANPTEQTILVNIDKSTQQMTVFVDGVERYHWPVSTGRIGYSTPSGTFTATSMNEIWYSKEWDNAPMPHAIFFMKDGHAIHGSYEVKYLGKPASHGCVRISPQNASILYDLVKKTGLQNTQVVLSGETPGGEGKVATSVRSGGKVASSGKSWTRYRQAAPSPFQFGNNYYAESDDLQRRRRGGFFRRLFGGQ
jgi:L,D-transpeptidase-like protein